jgi:hypothetical protein
VVSGQWSVVSGQGQGHGLALLAPSIVQDGDMLVCAAQGTALAVQSCRFDTCAAASR